MEADDEEPQFIEYQYESSEEVEPTNPYSVLDIRGKFRTQVSESTLDEAFEIKMAPFAQTEETSAISGATGVRARQILQDRLLRAHEILKDPERKMEYDKMVEEKLRNGTWAMLKYKNATFEGNVREGSIKEGKPVREGKGVTTLDGQKYEGEYHDNLKHGFGTMFYETGDMYRGQWYKDQQNGKGLYCSNGGCYKGDFRAGKRHGKGILAWANGDTYTGQFKEEKRTGYGCFQYASGPTYKGQWEDGKEHGEGMYTSARDGVYEGQFACGVFSGYGHQELANGDVYHGAYSKGKREGEGAYAWSNGNRYEGQLRANQRNGTGTFTSADKRIEYVGEWKGNVPHGAGKSSIISEDGLTVYDGRWKDGAKEGPGKIEWPSGDNFTGIFFKDDMNGKGTLIWTSGSQLEINFAMDKADGAGKYTIPADGDKPERVHMDTWMNGALYERDGVFVAAVPPGSNSADATAGAPPKNAKE